MHDLYKDFSSLPDPTVGERVRLLAEAATQARLQAYAPYSRFMVGSAILTQDGRVFTGVNVETANYDGSHAEENAIGAMVQAGSRSPALILTVGALETETHPSVVASCGKCISVLWEFRSLSGDPFHMVVANSGGRLQMLELQELLTVPFGPADIGVDLAKYRR